VSPKTKKRKLSAGDVVSNRQAAYRYNLGDRYECGLVLTGTEVKSLREGKAQLKDSYAMIRDGEVFLVGMYIPPYGPYFAGARSRAKVEIAVATGKNLFDKRDTIRQRDMTRDVQRQLRDAGR
jgi:SsrA-binding protein